MEFLAGCSLGFGLGWLTCALVLYIYVKSKGRKDKYVNED